MMMPTLIQLGLIMPHCRRLAELHAPLCEAMQEFGISEDTGVHNGEQPGGVLRLPMFLAQIAHESMELNALIEIADGMHYEGNVRLGNTEPGDGPRFKGRGALQLTGRKNYEAASGALGLELVDHPELLEDPLHGFRAACWFWRVGAGLNLSMLARARLGVNVDLNDTATRGDFLGITMAINGAATDQAPSHHLRRVWYLVRALEVLLS